MSNDNPQPIGDDELDAVSGGAAQRCIRHIYRRGDSLMHIALAYGTTIQAILRVNPRITDPNTIRVGQVLLIPVNN